LLGLQRYNITCTVSKTTATIWAKLQVFRYLASAGPIHFDLAPHSPNDISELPRKACFRWFQLLFLLGLATTSAISQASAQEKAAKLGVVATFSILGDFARNVGGNQVDVTALVDPNFYSPTPADAEAIRNARLVIVNGLGLEGWLPRLIESSGGNATTVVATHGIVPR
jgi:zinc/manganese transport system substrate-binding protein